MCGLSPALLGDGGVLERSLSTVLQRLLPSRLRPQSNRQLMNGVACVEICSALLVSDPIASAMVAWRYIVVLAFFLAIQRAHGDLALPSDCPGLSSWLSSGRSIILKHSPKIRRNAPSRPDGSYAPANVVHLFLLRIMHVKRKLEEDV